MNPKLKCILLIDDDEATNFLHERVIRLNGCAEEVVAVTNGRKGLEYLMNLDNTVPDLIFLDINMPAMNGFEFLEAYAKLEEERKAKIVIVMLTTSLNPDDQERAMSTQAVNDFANKPLTAELLQEILETHFVEPSHQNE